MSDRKGVRQGVTLAMLLVAALGCDLAHAQETAPAPRVVNEVELDRFRKAYFSARFDTRAVFGQHLSSLGPDVLLDFLESAFPLCHSQAHALGQAIYARVGQIDAALHACSTRCTSGCMHGVLMEALAPAGSEGDPAARSQHVTLRALEDRMAAFCERPAMADRYPPGNCAHGIGHALMLVTGRDVDRSTQACERFQDAAMAYYCATGVYMERFTPDRREDLLRAALHFPCDTYRRFPAACYKYRAPQMLQALGRDAARLARECAALQGPRRAGCFHGLGAAHTEAIFARPGLLREACAAGTPDDRVVCIEGAIEKLADYSEARALVACGGLDRDGAAVCGAAAREKMYRLGKPSMRLYTGR